MICALGGIDQILCSLLKSNASINPQELLQLHHVINNTSPYKQQTTNAIDPTSIHNMEDRRCQKKVTFNFVNDDILLYHIFEKETANTIIQILRSTITITILAIIWCILIIVISL
eukprot:382925_1